MNVLTILCEMDKLWHYELGLGDHYLHSYEGRLMMLLLAIKRKCDNEALCPYGSEEWKKLLMEKDALAGLSATLRKLEYSGHISGYERLYDICCTDYDKSFLDKVLRQWICIINNSKLDFSTISDTEWQHIYRKLSNV